MRSESASRSIWRLEKPLATAGRVLIQKIPAALLASAQETTETTEKKTEEKKAAKAA